jgi:multimeric flavodoxin WrbA
MKAVAIVGSPRADGNTNYLVDCALQEMDAAGIHTEKIGLHDKSIAPCQGHDHCRQLGRCEITDDAEWIIDKYLAADAVILATPVYFYMLSAQLKLFIDRNIFWRRHKQSMGLKATKAGVIVVSGGSGEDDTVRYLQRYFRAVMGLDPTQLHVLTATALALGDAKADPGLAERARLFGREMAGAMAAAH